MVNYTNISKLEPGSSDLQKSQIMVELIAFIHSYDNKSEDPNLSCFSQGLWETLWFKKKKKKNSTKYIDQRCFGHIYTLSIGKDLSIH